MDPPQNDNDGQPLERLTATVADTRGAWYDNHIITRPINHRGHSLMAKRYDEHRKAVQTRQFLKDATNDILGQFIQLQKAVPYNDDTATWFNESATIIQRFIRLTEMRINDRDFMAIIKGAVFPDSRRLNRNIQNLKFYRDANGILWDLLNTPDQGQKGQ